MADQAIGKAIVVYGEVKAESADGVERVLQPNSPIFMNDRLNTGSEGAVSIVFTSVTSATTTKSAPFLKNSSLEHSFTKEGLFPKFFTTFP